MPIRLILPIAVAGALTCAARADHPESLPAGHSVHGEAFNEGPRQKALLLPGMGHIQFPITTTVPLAQKFFEQGVGQLHGFFYFEAERSFRQVAALDPHCAMAYWGMAMANVNNAKRAREVLLKAEVTKVKASPREVMWIDSLLAFYRDEKRDEKERRKELTAALEKIARACPEDLEAKAFLALQMWLNSSKGVPYGDRKNVDKWLNEIVAVNPTHPANHYRIHLWDAGQQATNALVSAALDGASAPGIAHMWHMSGHTYSALRRYSDAAWQQEASARVDHAYMIQSRLLPDQIHNFAHNNEWLIRDLNHIGATRRAVDLAKNMVELPRHPKFNTLSKGSASYGHQRLIETLVRFEQWEELIALGRTTYLEPVEEVSPAIRRARALGIAFFNLGDVPSGRAQIAALEVLKKKAETRPPTPSPKSGASAAPKAAGTATPQITPSAPVANPADNPANNPATPASKSAPPSAPKSTDAPAKGSAPSGKSGTPPPSPGTMADNALAELQGWLALKENKPAAAREAFAKSKDLPKERMARIEWQLGDAKKSEQLALEAMKSATNQTQPIATYVDIAYRNGNYKEAYDAFFKLRELGAEVDLEAPAFAQLKNVARDLKLPADWRPPITRSWDFGKRPSIASLGPFRWHPSSAPDWSLPDASGGKISLRQFRGKPAVMIFYLGAGCVHCIEQISAFAPVAKDFSAAGISLVAVSTDSVSGLNQTAKNVKVPGALPFPLVSDQALKVFKSYRAYDDFEKKALHGTFLIDGEGLVRWQDISFQPFMETKFLLTEAQRLLGLPRGGAPPVPFKLAGQKGARSTEANCP